MRALLRLASRDLINPARVSPPGYPVALALAYVGVAWFLFCIAPLALR